MQIPIQSCEKTMTLCRSWTHFSAMKPHTYVLILLEEGAIVHRRLLSSGRHCRKVCCWPIAFQRGLCWECCLGCLPICAILCSSPFVTIKHDAPFSTAWVCLTVTALSIVEANEQESKDPVPRRTPRTPCIGESGRKSMNAETFALLRWRVEGGTPGSILFDTSFSPKQNSFGTLFVLYVSSCDLHSSQVTGIFHQ